MQKILSSLMLALGLCVLSTGTFANPCVDAMQDADAPRADLVEAIDKAVDEEEDSDEPIDERHVAPILRRLQSFSLPAPSQSSSLIRHYRES